MSHNAHVKQCSKHNTCMRCRHNIPNILQHNVHVMQLHKHNTCEHYKLSILNNSYHAVNCRMSCKLSTESTCKLSIHRLLLSNVSMMQLILRVVEQCVSARHGTSHTG